MHADHGRHCQWRCHELLELRLRLAKLLGGTGERFGERVVALPQLVVLMRRHSLGIPGLRSRVRVLLLPHTHLRSIRMFRIPL